ncbi:hypothetical protein PG997_012565 [Apiospora hydei]|uniref:Uncharacterized protein n=1 Tax=Apiospora hydei TaxID=1337664 RepID=A0ABR1V3Q6_9PEZI
MAWSSLVALTVEEQLGILALLIYLNLGIAWYYYSCRKSQQYQHFKHLVIGRPPSLEPVPVPVPVPASFATTTTTTTTTTPRRAPVRRGRFDGTWYALKRWVFVTASVLFWIVHALLLLVISLGTQLGATAAAGARVVYEWAWRRKLRESRRGDLVTELAAGPSPSSAEEGKMVTPAALLARPEMAHVVAQTAR